MMNAKKINVLSDAKSIGSTGSVIVSERDAAAELSLGHRTLQELRLKGGGPPFVKLTNGGRVGYRRSDLEAWAESRVVTSTSDTLAPRRR